MKKVLLVSPHFDDAILSAGQFMAERPDCEVVTVFGGLPPDPDDVHTDYDRKCGFKDARDAVGVRQQENNAATALLNATKIDLRFYDGQYGKNAGPEEIAIELQNLVNDNNYEFIMGPLGLGHPDHIKTRQAILRVISDLPVYLWEDLPLRVVEPELVWETMRQLGVAGKKLWQPATTGDKMAKKIRAVMCYKSQVGTGILDPYVMYVPERIWRIK